MDLLQQELDKRLVSDLLKPVSYEYPKFINGDAIIEELTFAIRNNKKILVHGDCDTDGVMCNLIIKDSFNMIGFKNYEIYKYRERSHRLSDEAVTYAIYRKFDYIIIADSSTNDMKNIQKLVNFGVKVIILDHHQSTNFYDDYPKDCFIINTIIENKEIGELKYKLSGGAVTFCLFHELLSRVNIKCDYLSAYALISLYADCIDMTSTINRGIYYMATAIPRADLPIYVKHFLEDYAIFTRRFISFTFTPKINALFRTEKLSILNKYLFDVNSTTEFAKLVDKIKEVHSQSRDIAALATDTIKVQNLNHIVIGNLNSCEIPVAYNNLSNYTGQVANNLSQDYGKPCVILCDNGNEIKGSLRDYLSRDYLSVFKQFCDAGGHNAAFGMHIPYKEFNEFMWYVKEKVDKKYYILGLEEPIVIHHDNIIPDLNLLNAIALYNEFSGIDIPIATISKKNLMSCRSSYSKSSNYSYTWGALTVESTSKLVQGAMIKIKPVLSKRLRLIVNSKNILI